MTISTLLERIQILSAITIGTSLSKNNMQIINSTILAIVASILAIKFCQADDHPILTSHDIPCDDEDGTKKDPLDYLPPSVKSSDIPECIVCECYANTIRFLVMNKCPMTIEERREARAESMTTTTTRKPLTTTTSRPPTTTTRKPLTTKKPSKPPTRFVPIDRTVTFGPTEPEPDDYADEVTTTPASDDFEDITTPPSRPKPVTAAPKTTPPKKQSHDDVQVNEIDTNRRRPIKIDRKSLEPQEPEVREVQEERVGWILENEKTIFNAILIVCLTLVFITIGFIIISIVHCTIEIWRSRRCKTLKSSQTTNIPFNYGFDF